MSVLFRRVRGRVPGEIFSINPNAVACLKQTMSNSTIIEISDVHALDSRDPIEVVEQLLEGRLRICTKCQRLMPQDYSPLCKKCCGIDEAYEACVADLTPGRAA